MFRSSARAMLFFSSPVSWCLLSVPVSVHCYSTSMGKVLLLSYVQLGLGVEGLPCQVYHQLPTAEYGIRAFWRIPRIYLTPGPLLARTIFSCIPPCVHTTTTRSVNDIDKTWEILPWGPRYPRHLLPTSGVRVRREIYGDGMHSGMTSPADDRLRAAISNIFIAIHSK